MARIGNRDTKPELLLRKALWAMGHRYRVHKRLGRIRPDLVFGPAKLVVFIDGCFWHGCPEHYVAPKTNRRSWAKKLKENVCRDQRQTKELLEEGWNVIRLWEHEVEENPVAAAGKVDEALDGEESSLQEDAVRVVRVDLDEDEPHVEWYWYESLQGQPRGVLRTTR
jgi:DNA mismatch endonuclease (patch repair protein)